MIRRNGTDNETIQLARNAADQLFDATDARGSSAYEPRNLLGARTAVKRLGERFEQLPGSIAESLEAARINGELLSPDRLQGLADILQNADDARASKVRLLLRDDDLLIGHNGEQVLLRHVLGMGLPWFSTKRAESESVGRFGIGLSALRSISSVIEVHCSPYHVRLGQPNLSSIDPPLLPSGFDEVGWTVFRVSLTEGAVSLDELVGWMDRWGDAGLLFLSNVVEVRLHGPALETIRRLSVSREAASSIRLDGSAVFQEIFRQQVKLSDQSGWIVYSASVPSPSGISRTYKEVNSTTPVGVALPLHQVSRGRIYAGLPVVDTPQPVFLNAQFDPLTSRRDLADTSWNRALVPLVADIWSHAAVDMFSLDPVAAWSAMPVGFGLDADKGSSLAERLCAAIIDISRNSVAVRIHFDVDDGNWLGLTQLAVEARSLEGVVTEEETATLLNMPATIPKSVRDGNGRWRMVLDEWREACSDLPEPLSVEQALVLLRDTNRSVKSTVALTVAGVREGLGERLAELPCLVASDGRRVPPPSKDSPEAVALEVSPLAEELGIVTALHAEYAEETDDACAIICWLREREALLDGTDNHVVVSRLSLAGKFGRRIEEPLTDGQVDALRRAFESLKSVERQEVGRNLGRAVVLSAYEYEVRNGRKRRRDIHVSPIKAYLPRSIDRNKDSFATAADRSPGVIWLGRHYAKVLKSTHGRKGIGAQRFLALLGAETAPRPREHPDLKRRYLGQPMGLSVHHERSPSGRTEAMRRSKATYTLDDWACDALTAVVKDIARVRRARKRRRRVQALLATLGRAWDRLSECAEVSSAYDYHKWVYREPMPAFWLWQVREVAWLDDESGTPRRPLELHIRSQGNEAIYGEDSPDFVHKELQRACQESHNWKAVMAALGVDVDPTRQELVSRLRTLRDEEATGAVRANASLQLRLLSTGLWPNYVGIM